MRLDDHTWPEVQVYLESNHHLILPVGTCEQHGPHLPLDTDTIIANRIADTLSGETGILVGPTLNYGVNLPCDQVYAGTCSTTGELLGQFLSSILAWWKGQGFWRFLVLSAHGDPQHIEALEAVDPGAVRVLELYDFDIPDILDRQQGAKHAGEVETSVVMFLYPDRVRREAIQDFETPLEQFEPYLSHQVQEPIPGSPGNQGYPSCATAEKGEVLYGLMLDHARRWLAQNMLSGREED